MDNENLESCLIAIINELRTMNNRIEVLIDEIEDIKQTEEDTNNILNSVFKGRQVEPKEPVIERDKKGRIMFMKPEDFLSLQEKGYSLNQIVDITGWSKSKVQYMIDIAKLQEKREEAEK